MDKRIERLEAMRDEIGDIANTFAGDVTGTAAAELHGAAGRISNAVRMLTEGITLDDKVTLAEEWCDKQSFPMSPSQRLMVTQLLAK